MIDARIEDPSASLCWHCRGPRILELFEVWGDREFLFETCCEQLHEEVSQSMSDDPKFGAQLLNEAGIDHLHCSPPGGVRRVVDAGGQLVIDWNLHVDSAVPFSTAKAFVLEHHRHCPPPAGWRFGAGIFNGRALIGVVMVGRPVARAFDHTKVVEVNRLCVRCDIDPQLVWNACSKLYGWAAREARKRGFERVITYVMEHEAGTTLKAAGWSIEATTRGRSWSAPSRPRQDKMQRVDKVRWGRTLNPVARFAQGAASADRGRTGRGRDSAAPPPDRSLTGAPRQA